MFFLVGKVVDPGAEKPIFPFGDDSGEPPAEVQMEEEVDLGLDPDGTGVLAPAPKAVAVNDAAIARGPPIPVVPSQEEVDAHELSHLPFRPWCAACVSGRAQDAPHLTRISEKYPGVPVVMLVVVLPYRFVILPVNQLSLWVWVSVQMHLNHSTLTELLLVS